MVPPQDFFGLFPSWIAVYSLTAIAFSVAGFATYRRVFRLILLGRSIDPLNRPIKRLVRAISPTFGQTKVLRSVSLKDRAGLAHLIIFWGFLSFALSYLLFIFADSIRPSISTEILTETGVSIYAAYLDFLALILLVVIVWAGVRRWMIRPSRLRFDLTQKFEAGVILFFILMLMVFSILSEAFYISAGNLGPTSAAIVGSKLGQMMTSAGLSTDAAVVLHSLTWWAHLVVILGFAIYIPISKHVHIIASPISLYLRDLQPMGALSTPKDLENANIFGAASIEDFTRKELLDGFACAVCGRCTDACPANLSGKGLSPMHIVENLKEYVTEVGPLKIVQSTETIESSAIGPWISEDDLWDCLTCGACEQVCPVGVEHLDMIVDMRRHLVMERSEMPDQAVSVLTNMEQRGHPWKGTQYTRTDWAEGLEVTQIADNPDTDILLWIGCTSALEQRSQRVARAMVSVLKHADVDFSILGREETCTGDPARRMGNEYLYQSMARKTINVLKKHSFKTIVTLCPHCFNVMKNEYPHLGGNYEVLHYSEMVERLISDGRIKPIINLDVSMTYHDSCYLGRHNGIYDPPRRIAEAIPGLQLVEMDKNRQNGFCCGAGGGHMWIDETKGRRVNHIRTEQFLQSGANVVGVSCPFCLQMFEEGVGSLKDATNKDARDIIELLDESLG